MPARTRSSQRCGSRCGRHRERAGQPHHARWHQQDRPVDRPRPGPHRKLATRRGAPADDAGDLVETEIEHVGEDRGHLVPINTVVARSVEVEADPSSERSCGRLRRAKESSGLGRDSLFGGSRWRGAPEGDATVTTMVVVEIAERLGAEKETGLAVADTLVDAGQRERECPNVTQPVLNHQSDSRAKGTPRASPVRRLDDAPISVSCGEDSPEFAKVLAIRPPHRCRHERSDEPRES